MNTFQISTFIGQINNQSIQLVNARDLHEGLQISTPFHKWIQRRIADFNFIENLDFTVTDKFVRLDRGMFGMRDVYTKRSI